MNCTNCGKEIKTIRVKGKNIPVSKGTILVIPCEFGNVNTFIATYGAFIKGYVSDDGIECHIIHKCNKKTVDSVDNKPTYQQMKLSDFAN